ncbi:MAG TPA: RDD family protein [Verrucomicrobiae bacterium]|nr:RDD family protein [Verrucomicrobiae bacterium]
MNWYYADQGQPAGPVTEEQFTELVRSGKIQPDTLVWREGMAAWAPYREVSTPTNPSVPASAGGSGYVAGQSAEAACAECGKLFAIQDMIRHGGVYICANCKPVFMQKLAEGAPINTGELNYAGFWIRFAAKLLDGLILGVPLIVVFMLVMIPQIRSGQPTAAIFLPYLVQFCFIFVQMAYQIFFLGKYGATLGKMACKIKVVTPEGGRIGYGRATGRFFAEMLSGMICYIGYLMVAFDGQKRALHDHICNTRVVYR